MSNRRPHDEETKAKIAATLRARNSTPEGAAARREQNARRKSHQEEVRQALRDLVWDTSATGAAVSRLAESQEKHNTDLTELVDDLMASLHHTQDYVTDAQVQIQQNQRDLDHLLTLVTLILAHVAPGQTADAAAKADTDAQGGDQTK